MAYCWYVGFNRIQFDYYLTLLKTVIEVLIYSLERRYCDITHSTGSRIHDAVKCNTVHTWAVGCLYCMIILVRCEYYKHIRQQSMIWRANRLKTGWLAFERTAFDTLTDAPFK
jgi:hypothetical protein